MDKARAELGRDLAHAVRTGRPLRLTDADATYDGQIEGWHALRDGVE